MQEYRSISVIAPGFSFSQPSRDPLRTVGVGAIVSQDAAGTTPATRDGDPVGRVDTAPPTLADRLGDLALRYSVAADRPNPVDPTGVWYSVTLVDHKGKPMGVQHLPGALATTGAAHHHGNALARAERHLAGDTIGPKRRRRYRRLLARGGR